MSNFGQIDRYIKGAAVKRLSAVEANPNKSNQHELNGVSILQKLLGQVSGSQRIKATFLRLEDDLDDAIVNDGEVSWYDARKGHPNRSEYRLYYPSPCVAMDHANEDDTVVIAQKKDGSLLLITAERASSAERGLIHLFGSAESAWSLTSEKDVQNTATFDRRGILEKLGIFITQVSSTNYLEAIEENFGELSFPTTSEFSKLARELAPPLEDFSTADEALVSFYETETAMFYQLEEALIFPKIQAGFLSTEDFFRYSKSWSNRRKARAGTGLENHLEAIFRSRNLNFTREPRTEGKKKPDFIFPSISSYHDTSFSPNLLHMVACKTSAKDRWRQILSEAERISYKHLFTLESPISENQTTEMQDAHVQLVVPSQSHPLFTENQKRNLWDLEALLEFLKSSQ